MIRAQWEWAFDDAEGHLLAQPVSPVFANQFDAEQWLGEHWRDLAAQDAAVSRLIHNGTQAAAPVALRIP